MGTAEILSGQILIKSHIVTYGNAAGPSVTEQMRDEIETMWNEPRASIDWRGQRLLVVFRITSESRQDISPTEIYENVNPENNYFRIEEFAHGNISFVDGIGCNTGYFKLENLYKGSTTAAHEYGHTMGLIHPDDLDLRGKGVPGIMYPRGTLVDPQFQYNPAGRAGDSNNGGTMHPKFRKVQAGDIELLKLSRLLFTGGRAVIGEFTSIWHPDHAAVDA
jgi:hypothetical protein